MKYALIAFGIALIGIAIFPWMHKKFMHMYTNLLLAKLKKLALFDTSYLNEDDQQEFNHFMTCCALSLILTNAAESEKKRLLIQQHFWTPIEKDEAFYSAQASLKICWCVCRKENLDDYIRTRLTDKEIDGIKLVQSAMEADPEVVAHSKDFLEALKNCC